MSAQLPLVQAQSLIIIPANCRARQSHPTQAVVSDAGGGVAGVAGTMIKAPKSSGKFAASFLPILP